VEEDKGEKQDKKTADVVLKGVALGQRKQNHTEEKCRSLTLSTYILKLSISRFTSTVLYFDRIW
jgi:hypothetical protein